MSSEPVTSHAGEFAIGDQVVLLPAAVMEISAIGTRRELTPEDCTNVIVDVRRTLQDGGSPLVAVDVDDERVYALRIVGESQVAFLLEQASAQAKGLRRVSSAAEIDRFLELLRQFESATTGPSIGDAHAAMMQVLRAGNRLDDLARVYPDLRRRARHDEQLETLRATLERFFVHEIAIAKSVTTDDAREQFERAIG